MRKITIILILFQLIGCAKQPVVITHPENKQETLQHDTPQASKTNYLKIGVYIGGVILTILASIGLIAYYCSRKGEKEPVTDQKEQNKEDKSLTLTRRSQLKR
jgi:hypothetical protein